MSAEPAGFEVFQIAAGLGLVVIRNKTLSQAQTRSSRTDKGINDGISNIMCRWTLKTYQLYRVTWKSQIYGSSIGIRIATPLICS